MDDAVLFHVGHGIQELPHVNSRKGLGEGLDPDIVIKLAAACQLKLNISAQTSDCTFVPMYGLMRKFEDLDNIRVIESLCN